MPEVIPAYWLCPRCQGRDVYFAKRVVGQIGTILDLPYGVSNPGFFSSVEKEVPLCKNCGEGMNKIDEKKFYAKEELEAITRKSGKAWGRFFMWTSIPLILVPIFISSNLDEPSGNWVSLFGIIWFIRGWFWFKNGYEDPELKKQVKPDNPSANSKFQICVHCHLIGQAGSQKCANCDRNPQR